MGRKSVFLILSLIVLAHLVANAVWLKDGLSLYGKDIAGHLKVQSTIYYRLREIVSGGGPTSAIPDLVSLMREEPLPFLGGAWTWPKLFYIYTSAVNLVCGFDPVVTILANIPFLALLVASVYCAGATIGGKESGLLAAFLVSFYPAVFGLSRKYGLDFPLAAMVALSMAVLIRNPGFESRKKSLLLGVVVGLGILIKGQMALFVAGPCLVSLLVSPRRETRGRPRRFLNLSLACAVAAGVSSVWWWGILGRLSGAYLGHVEEGLSLPLNLTFPAFSFGWWTFYLFYSAIDISPLLFVFFLVALPVFLFTRLEQKWTLLAWIVVPYLLWTFTRQKSYLYYFPSYPAFACVTAIGLSRVRPRRAALFLSGIAVLWTVLQFWQFSFAGVRLIGLPVKKLVNPDGRYTVYHSPVPNNYREALQGFVEEINRQSADTRYLRVGLIEMESSIWQENTSDAFDYYMRLRDPRFSLCRSHFTRQSFVVNCRSFAYIIVLSRGDLGEAVERTRRYYLDSPSRRTLVDRIWGIEEFEGALSSYGDYEVLRRLVLQPDDINLFLCRKPSIPIAPGMEIAAVGFLSAKIIVHPPFITSDPTLAFPVTIEDSDMLFPLSPPAAAPGPDFVEYRVESLLPLTLSLSAICRIHERGTLSVRVNGDTALGDVSLEPALDRGKQAWHEEPLGDISLPSGQSLVRIEGDRLPDLKAIQARETR